jgi:hypothetical protein
LGSSYSQHATQNLVNKVRKLVLINRKPKQQHQVLTEEKLDGVRAWLEHSPSKSLKYLAEEMRVSEGTTETYKITEITTLQNSSCNHMIQ